MKYGKLSEAYLRQAEYRLTSAREALRRKNFAYCVRLSQEVVELSTKGLLRSVGVEYPKFHDTSPALRTAKDRFPRGVAESLAEASEELARFRALAMYGDENKNLGPNEIFGRDDAEGALEKARKAYADCLGLTRGVRGKRR